MRRAKVYINGVHAGILEEVEKGSLYRFSYVPNYAGEPVSLLMPVREASYEFDRFPPFFDGILPEGMQLEALLKRAKIDRDDLFQQLITVGGDLVGNVTVEGFE